MITPKERADQIYNAFFMIVNDKDLAKKLSLLSVDNMSWAAYVKHESDYFSKMKKHIYDSY